MATTATITDDNSGNLLRAELARLDAALRAKQLELDQLSTTQVQQQRQLADITNGTTTSPQVASSATSGSGVVQTIAAGAGSDAHNVTAAGTAPLATASSSGVVLTAIASAGTGSSSLSNRPLSIDPLDNEEPPRKRTRRSRHVAPAETLAPDGEFEAINGGKRLALKRLLFLRDDTLDPTKQPAIPFPGPVIPLNRFDSDFMRSEAERDDIRAELAPELRSDITRRAVSVAIIDGLQQERYRLRSRMVEAAVVIVGPIWAGYIVSEELDCAEFRAHIGFKAGGTQRSVVAYWDHDAPCLHTFAEDTYYDSKPAAAPSFGLDIKTRFCNPQLIRVYIALYRGTSALTQFLRGHLRIPPNCVEKLHGITEVSPCAIAVCAVLYIFLLSADTEFREIGNNTGIDYRGTFQRYHELLMTGLAKSRQSYVDLFQHWNDTLFPGKPTTQKFGVRKTGMLRSQDSMLDELEEDAPAKNVDDL